MKQIIKKIIIIILILAVAAFLEFNDKTTPTIRKDIKNPIYTVGDSNYAKALAEKRGVVKFGPLFGGLYPGGKAFNDVESAKTFIKENYWGNEFSVYKLSGDYSFDVTDGFTNKSLIVIEKAN